MAPVWPIMTEALESEGLPLDIVPLHPKMAGLVEAGAELSAGPLMRKRGWGRRAVLV